MQGSGYNKSFEFLPALALNTVKVLRFGEHLLLLSLNL